MPRRILSSPTVKDSESRVQRQTETEFPGRKSGKGGTRACAWNRNRETGLGGFDRKPVSFFPPYRIDGPSRQKVGWNSCNMLDLMYLQGCYRYGKERLFCGASKAVKAGFGTEPVRPAGMEDIKKALKEGLESFNAGKLVGQLDVSLLRSRADSNCCKWFCRPVPNLSATRPCVLAGKTDFLHRSGTRVQN